MRDDTTPAACCDVNWSAAIASVKHPVARARLSLRMSHWAELIRRLEAEGEARPPETLSLIGASQPR